VGKVNVVQKGRTMADEEGPEQATINIGNISDGEAMNAFDLYLHKIMENIADLSTIATATRSITLRFDFKPESDRCTVHVEMHCSTKTAPIEKHVSKMFMGRTQEGALVALDEDPRQLTFWTAPAPKEVPVVEFRNGK
jgi:hypothetical protein